MYKIKRFSKFNWDLNDLDELINKSNNSIQFIKLLSTKFHQLRFMIELRKIEDKLAKDGLDPAVYLIDGLDDMDEFPDDFYDACISIRSNFKNNNLIPLCIYNGVYLIYNSKDNKFLSYDSKSRHSRLHNSSVRKFIDDSLKDLKNNFELEDEDFIKIVRSYNNIR